MKNILALIGFVVVGWFIWNVLSESLTAPTAPSSDTIPTTSAPKTAISADSKCQIAAKQWMDSWAPTLGPDDSVTYRYNLGNNGGCYVLANYNFSWAQDGVTWSQSTTYTLADVYRNDPNGHPVWIGTFNLTNNAYSGVKLLECNVNGTQCSNLDGFLAKTKIYMEN